MTTIDRPITRRPMRTAGSVLLAGLLAGVVGLAAAGLGAIALAGVAVVIAGIVGWALVGDLLQPHLRAAAERARPRGRGTPAASRARRAVVGTVVTLTAGVLAWGLAAQGLIAVGAVLVLLAVAAACWLLAPLLADLMFAEPADLPGRQAPRWLVPSGSRWTGPIGVAVAVVGAGALALVVASFGLKGLLVTLGLVAAVALLVVVRDRSVFFTFAAVCSLVLVLHKSFSAQDLMMSGGAISIYVTTFDAVVLLLYVIWMSEGTFVADVRAVRAEWALRIPLVGALLLLPSLLVATSLLNSASELVRMGWMYLLFFYVAVRIRTRRHVWAVLGGLVVFAVIELTVVVLQAKTGGVLGLSFLGVPTELGERVTEAGSLGRPFGTINHPIFMGATMAVVGLVALALAFVLHRSVPKLTAIGIVGVCVVPMYLAQTRAALLTFALMAVGIAAVALKRGFIQWRTIGTIALVLLAGVAVMWPRLAATFEDNFATDHFSEEVVSRAQLNTIGMEMFADHPVLGVGLNNFERTMGPYEDQGIIFPNHPVHNLYLLFLSETGVVGMAGIVVVGVGMLLVALRLSRARDRLYAGIGIGVSAALVFFFIEEVMGFALRQDIPLLMFWLLAGLAVACLRLARASESDPDPTTDVSPVGRSLAMAGRPGSGHHD